MVTTQRTGKVLKSLIALAMGGFLLGLIWAFTSEPAGRAGGFVLAIFSLLFYLIIRLAAWWFHG